MADADSGKNEGKAQAGRPPRKKRRTVIIGIDGVPFRLMDELSEKGVMPNFARLRKDGVFRKMSSSIPEISSVSWSSIITGRNPGEHGVFGFTDMLPGTYTVSFPNFSSLKAPAFWQADAAAGSEKRGNNRENAGGNSKAPGNGRKYVIINVPSTYPAQELNGFLVSGFVSLDLERATYPKSYVPKLTEMGYQIDVDASKGHKSKSLLLDELFRVHGLRMKAVRELWDSVEWDVFMAVFTGSDRLGHFLWDAYEDPGHEHHQRFLDYFAEIDKAIGELVSKMASQDSLLICSDHGMELAEKSVNVNQVLVENGYLILDNKPGLQYNNIKEGTKAFAMDPGRIYINRIGMYPRGCVRPAGEEEIIGQLAKLFSGLEVDGKKVMKAVYRSGDIYKGPHAEKGPDIVLLPNKGFNLKSSLSELLDGSEAREGVLTGKHSQDDAFLFVKGKENMAIVPDKPSVEDIAGILEKL